MTLAVVVNEVLVVHIVRPLKHLKTLLVYGYDSFILPL